MTARIVVVDDHFVTRAGTIAILERDPRYNVVGEASSGAEALALCRKQRPDLALLDLRLPDMDGPSVARTLRATMTTPPKVLMLSAYGDAASVRTALEAGASGYVLKSVAGAALLQAIAQTLRGERVLMDVEGGEDPDGEAAQLSPQELMALEYVAQGLRAKEIAERVGASPRTIETYVARIYKKLGARNRTQALNAARRLGLLKSKAE